MMIISEGGALYSDETLLLNVTRIKGEGKPQWHYSVWKHGASLVTSGDDLHSWSSRDALSSLASFLENESEKYSFYMGVGQPPDGYLFGETVAEWAYGVSDELSLVGCAIDEEST